MEMDSESCDMSQYLINTNDASLTELDWLNNLSPGVAEPIRLDDATSYFGYEDPIGSETSVLVGACPMCNTACSGYCQSYINNSVSVIPPPEMTSYQNAPEPVTIDLEEAFEDINADDARVQRWIKGERGDENAVGQTQDEFLDQLYNECIGDDFWQVPKSYNDELDQIMMGLANPVIVTRFDTETEAGESFDEEQNVEPEEAPVLDHSIEQCEDVAFEVELSSSAAEDLKAPNGWKTNIHSPKKSFEGRRPATLRQLFGKSVKITKIKADEKASLSDTTTGTEPPKTRRKRTTGSEKDLLPCPADDCSRMYLLKASLQHHLKKKHPELYTPTKRTPHVCTDCLDTFTAKTKLAAHRRLCSQITKKGQKVRNDPGWISTTESYGAKGITKTDEGSCEQFQVET